MTKFDQWLEQNPYRWHPGRGHAEELHAVWVQQVILSMLDCIASGCGDMVKDWLVELERELPEGFMGPYDLEVYVRHERRKVELERDRLSEQFLLSFDKLASHDVELALNLLGQMRYRAQKMQQLTVSKASTPMACSDDAK